MHHLKTKLFIHCKNDPLTCIFFFFISNKISLKENNQLQRAKAHMKCAELNMKINKTKMHEKHNYQAKQVRN